MLCVLIAARFADPAAGDASGDNRRVDADELAARRAVLEAFAATGLPPDGIDRGLLRRLADRRIVLLDQATAAILMAPPFAAPPGGVEVRADKRWWGSCAFDGLGIIAALGLREATLVAGDIELAVRDGRPDDETLLFHVAVPAAAWPEDMAYT